MPSYELDVKKPTGELAGGNTCGPPFDPGPLVSYLEANVSFGDP